VPDTVRPSVRRRFHRIGFHAEKRSGVRTERFRSLPPKVQEALSGPNYETLREVYDAVPMDTLREAIEGLSRGEDSPQVDSIGQ
jgi:hypothetical protein